MNEITEVIGAVKGLKDLTDIVGAAQTRTNGSGNGNKKGSKKTATGGRDGSEAYSDVYDSGTHPAALTPAKTPYCYLNAMQHMHKLTRLQERVDLRNKMKTNRMLQIEETVYSAMYTALTKTIFRGPIKPLLATPIPKLEELINSQISEIVHIEQEVGKAVAQSQYVVDHLVEYDKATMKDFEQAKCTLQEFEQRQNTVQQDLKKNSARLEHATMDDKHYTAIVMEKNDLKREEKEIENRLRVEGQKVQDTYKQAGDLRSKEDVARAALHQFRLVNNYISRFLTFVKRSEDADELVPHMVEAVGIVTKAYQVLSGIVYTRTAATTQSVEQLVSSVGEIDYRVLPKVQSEVNRQKQMLTSMQNGLDPYQQAVIMMRGKLQDTPQQYTPAQQA